MDPNDGHCCGMMAEQMRTHLGCSIPEHVEYPALCADSLIAQSSGGGYGIRVHDGGSSFVMIAYCPWCATQLPDGEDVRTKPGGPVNENAVPEEARDGAMLGRVLDLG